MSEGIPPQEGQPGTSLPGGAKAGRRVKKSSDAEPPADLNRGPTPTDRIVRALEAHISSHEDRIDLLEEERRQFHEECDRRGKELARLLAENARYNEVLRSTTVNGTLATVIITIGGGAMGYAAYVPDVAREVASVGMSVTVVGVIIMIVTSIRGGRAA